MELREYLEQVDQAYETLSGSDLESRIRALTDACRLEYGEESAPYASMLGELGAYYRGQGRYEESEDCFQRSLKLLENTVGKESPAYATALNNLASVHRFTGRYADAEREYAACLALYRRTVGTGDVLYAAGRPLRSGLSALRRRPLPSGPGPVPPGRPGGGGPLRARSLGVPGGQGAHGNGPSGRRDGSAEEERMKGLELARRYWLEVGQPALAAACPQAMDRLAVGLVGEGSECLGYDDAISQDHDWGPGFCVWLDRDDLDRWGETLRAAYAALPKTFLGFTRLRENDMSAGRVGVLECAAFYQRFLGLDRPPETNRQWFFLPDQALSVCTNGAVFQDGAGTFTAFREALLAYYPEEVRRMKLAAQCALAAPAGQ